ncbi:MAG: hypothetical protein AB7F59_03880 [Bdellovibrionales bacterium]
MSYKNLFCLITILLFSRTSFVEARNQAPKKSLKSVNEHMTYTHKKMQLEKDKVEVDNSLSAPNIDQSASFTNQADYSSFGVNMQTEPGIQDTSLRKSYKPKNSDALIQEQIYEEQNQPSESR